MSAIDDIPSFEVGPLDIIRSRGVEACFIDGDVRRYAYGDEIDDAYRQKALALAELNNSHPIFMKPVVVEGIPVERIEHNYDEGYPLRVDPNAEVKELRGEYRGFNILPVYDSESGERVYRVLHAVGSEETKHLSPYGDILRRNIVRYVLATPDTKVTPFLPVNGHSLVDLFGDPLVLEMDKIISAMDPDEANRVETIRELGRCINELLEQEPGERDINNQRASYLNAQRVLGKGAVMVGGIAVIHDKLRKPRHVLEAGRLKVRGVIFDIAAGVRPETQNSAYRLVPAEMFVMGTPPRGCTLPNISSSTVLSMPLREVLELEYIET